MSKAYFSHELREFRQEFGLSRKEMAQILGLSDSTVRAWENGQANPQSSTLWGVMDRLSLPESARVDRKINLERLKSIVTDYAKSLDLSPVENFQSKLVRIERTLSGSVLKAAQTDFIFNPNGRVLKTIPFYADLELFEKTNQIAVRHLLENASESAKSILPKLESVNIEQRYFSESLRRYAEECDKDVPNPRILERKGEFIKFVYHSKEAGQSLNVYLLKEIEQFIDVHNELMRGLFGEALAASRAVHADGVADHIFDIDLVEFKDAVEQLQTLVHQSQNLSSENARIDRGVLAVVEDVEQEISDLKTSVEQANDPTTRALRLARFKIASFHRALLLGRLILRATGVAFTFGANAATIAMVLDIAQPGSIRSAYEILESVIPELPSLPIL